MAMPARPAPEVLPVRREPGLPGERGDVPGPGHHRPRRHRAGRGTVDRHAGVHRVPRRAVGRAHGRRGPGVGPGPFYLPRAIRDWKAMPHEDARRRPVPAPAERRRPRPEVRHPPAVEAPRLARVHRRPPARRPAAHEVAAGGHLRDDVHRPAERTGPDARDLPGGRARLPPRDPRGAAHDLPARGRATSRWNACRRPCASASSCGRRAGSGRRRSRRPPRSGRRPRRRLEEKMSTWTGTEVTRDDVLRTVDENL